MGALSLVLFLGYTMSAAAIEQNVQDAAVPRRVDDPGQVQRDRGAAADLTSQVRRYLPIA